MSPVERILDRRGTQTAEHIASTASFCWTLISSVMLIWAVLSFKWHVSINPTCLLTQRCVNRQVGLICSEHLMRVKLSDNTWEWSISHIEPITACVCARRPLVTTWWHISHSAAYFTPRLTVPVQKRCHGADMIYSGRACSHLCFQQKADCGLQWQPH